MTDQTNDLPSDRRPASTVAQVAAAGKKHKWRRRFIRVAIAIVVIVLLLRASLSLLLPWAINRAAAQYDLSCRYERMDLYLLDGDVGLWHLVVAPKNGGAPFLKAEYCRGDISTLQLLRGHLVVQQAVADGAEVNLERQADGTIPLLNRLTMLKGSSKPTSTIKTGTLDLTSPLQIDAFRLQHVSAHVRDLAVSPPVEAQFDMDLRLSDLGSGIRPAKLWMEGSSPGLLDVMRVEGEGSSANQALDATLHFFVRGLHAKPAAGYLQLLGIRPVAESLSVLADAKLKLSPAATPSAFAGSAAIEKILVSADGRPSIAVDRIAVDAASVGQGPSQLGKFSVDGVRIDVDRTPDGSVRFAGFELAPTPASQNHTSSATGSVPPSIALQIPLHLAEFAVSGVKVSFRDQGVSPATELHLEVPGLSIKNIDTDSTRPQIATIEAMLLIPGVLRSATMSGTATPFAARKATSLTFQVEGLRPEVIRPYMDALGLQSELKDASLTAQMNATLSAGADLLFSADARLHDIHFRDGPALLDLDEIKIAGLGIDAALTRIEVDDFEIMGPKFAASRDVNGVLSALGMRLDPKNWKRSAANVSATTGEASQPARAITLPRIDLHHFAWKGVEVHLNDNGVQPPTSISFSDAGVELSEFHIDPQSKAAHGSTGKIRASLKAPGLAGNMLVTGTLTPIASGLSGDLELNGDGVATVIAAPYLRGLGIEPLLQDGSLHLLARFDVRSTEHGLRGSGGISRFKLVEDGKELVSVESASVKGFDLSPRKISVDSVEIDRPRIEIEREAGGTLRAAGLRLLWPATEPSPVTQGTAAHVAAAATTPPAAETAQPIVVLNHLKVTGAGLVWSDHTVSPAVEASGAADVTLDHFNFAPNAAPADLTVTANAEGIVDRLKIGGTVLLQPKAANVKLTISASGLRQGALVAYVPPQLRVNLKDGRLTTSMEAAIGENPQGGHGANLTVAGLSYRDGSSEPSLLKLDGAKVIVSRFDLPGRICAIDEVSLAGLETRIAKAPGGEIQLLGLSLVQPSPAATLREGPLAIATPLENGGPSRPPALTADQILAEHHKPFPLVTLSRLNLSIRAVNITDLSRPQSAPLTLADVELKNRAPIKLLGKDPTSGEPVALRVTGAVNPVIAGFMADIDFMPFAQQPELHIDVTAGGINGAGLMAIAPEIKASNVDCSRLADGHFRMHLDAQAKVFRRSAVDVDLSRPFDIDVDLKNLEFRDGGAGPRLAGLEEVRSDGIHVDPAKNLVLVRSLEITNPSATAFRDADGLHALGLIVKLPMSPANPAAQTQPAAPAASPVRIAQRDAPATTQHSSPDQGEIQIAKLLVSGLDVRFEDRAVSPEAVVPLTGLDAEVRDLSSRMLQEDNPVRFSLLVNSGKVTLPKHLRQGAISGAVADLRVMSSGQQVLTAPELEQRDLFSQMDAFGKISLYPRPLGWVKSSISGLELGEFKGEAKALGLTLDDGTFDYSADVRCPGDGSMQVRVRPVFTDLQMSEPPNGPVVRMLHFPAPLDVVLAALRDPEGGIAVPLDVPIKQGKLATGDVINAGVGAVGAIVATALASAPVKAASAAVDTVGDVVGAFTPLGFLFKKPPPEKPVPLTFSPGETVVSSSDFAAVRPLIEKLRKDGKLELTVRHELSEGDVARAEVRANPSSEDARRLAAQLRARRADLLQLRAAIVGQERFELASSAPNESADTRARLRAVQRDLAGVEDGLDQMYELLRPGADRLAVRRTRQAALQIAQTRLDAVQAAVLASGISGIDKRLRILHPQFTPSDYGGGGNVTLLIVKKK